MDVFDMVGNTPLIEIKNLKKSKGIKIYAKAEFMNPSGSVKDRAAKAILLDGIKTKKLTKDKIIIDATSGNTGISYAMLGAAIGYRVRLCMPQNVSVERKRIIRAYGAEIVETDPLEGVDGAYYEARRIVKDNPDKYFYPDQYSNPANWQAHYSTTAREIWEQTNKSVTHFVVGTGTSGTFTGTARGLKELNTNIETYYMQPDSPFHGIEGLKQLDTSMRPKIFDLSLADGRIEISTEEAYKMGIRLARDEGLFVGISSGANIAAAYRLAESVPEGSVIVTVLCDGGTRYFSSPMWEDIE